MNRPPRPPGEGVFNRLMISQTLISGVVMGLLAFAAWFWTQQQGWPLDEARNAVLLLMVLLENVHVFNCRSERISAFRVPMRRNRLLIGGVLVAQSIHVLIMFNPLMQRVLSIQPVSLAQWSYLLLLASLLLLVMEVFKLVTQPDSTATEAP